MSAPPAWIPLEAMPRAYGGAPLEGRLRLRWEDFQVDEELGFEPDGEGEHGLLLIRKSGLNTEDLVRRVARHAGVRPLDVGYSGLKDRNAVTTQWLSVGLAGRPEPDWSGLDDERVQVLRVERHRRKLKRGTARGNRFHIRLGEAAGDRAAAEQCLQAMAEQGVPDYFGEQRFGRDAGNLEQAGALFRGERKGLRPHLRGLYLSAVRAQIFNEVLAERVRAGTWERPQPGDLLQLAGRRAWFAAPQVDAELEARAARQDIHPTGPLWGAGEPEAGGAVAELERAVAARFPDWCRGLEQFGLRQERRALRMPVAGLTWAWDGADLELAFRLPAGCFATALLRELTGAAQ